MQRITYMVHYVKRNMPPYAVRREPVKGPSFFHVASKEKNGASTRSARTEQGDGCYRPIAGIHEVTFPI
jgi:hypothetical protein